MLTEDEQYVLRDLACKLEECRNYYINNVYRTLIYNENSFRDKNFYHEMVLDCEKQKYEHLATYKELMNTIPIDDLAMVHEEQLAIRDREMSRYEKGLASPKGDKSFNGKAYEKAYSIREEAFSHIVTNMESIEKQHPEIAEERAAHQIPRRGRHR